MSDAQGRPAGAAGAGQTGGPGFPDPFQMWKQWFDQNEQMFAKSMEQMVATPEFAKSMGKTMETFLAYQRNVRDNMRLWLEAANLPTREDIARLAEQVVHLEEKIDDLDDRVNDIVESAKRGAVNPAVDDLRAAIARLEQGGPEAIRMQLDGVLRKLNAIEAALKSSADVKPPATPRRASAKPDPADV